MRTKNIFKKIISLLLVFMIIIPIFNQLIVSAEEAEKYPYNLFGRNGITMNASNLCVNGSIHTNKTAEITANNRNINGKVTTGSDINKRVKHVYSDVKIQENYFMENCDLYEEEYIRSEMNIHINNPIFSYNNINLNGNVALNSNIGTLMNINVTGEVKNANNSVVYSKYGNITIDNNSTANINGLIYAPLGTLTINSPNVNLNGIIIADKIVINGSSVNINNNDTIARFIGTTSEPYDFSGLEYLPEDWLGDSDADELFDIYEKVIDTDPFNPDTDSDELPDGYEVLALATDPLEVDTDLNGIWDKDEDFDSDNLNNLGEYQNGTEPFIPDTDEDGLLDGDEVHLHGTDPLNPDTDNDGLLDGEEIQLNIKQQLTENNFLNPINKKSDGVTDDYQRTFFQNISAVNSVLIPINSVSENPYQLSIGIKSAGIAEYNLTVSESKYSYSINNNSVLGMIPEFTYSDGIKVEEVTVYFNLNNVPVNDSGNSSFDGIKRYNIFKYYEDVNMMFPIETSYDFTNNTVYAQSDTLGTYCIVDMEKWLNMMKNIPTEDEEFVVQEFTSPQKQAFSSSNELDIIFALDPHNFNTSEINNLKVNIQKASEKIFKKNSSATVHIYSDKITACSNMTQVNAALIGIKNLGSGDQNIPYSFVYDVYRYASTNLSPLSSKYCFLMVSYPPNVYVGSQTDVDNYKREWISLASYFQNNGINTSVIKGYPTAAGLSIFSAGSNFTKTGGKEIVYTTTTNFHQSMVVQIFGGGSSGDYPPPKGVALPIIVTSYGSVYLADNLNPDNGVDTDGDGIPDWEEVHPDFKHLFEFNNGKVTKFPTYRECVGTSGHGQYTFECIGKYGEEYEDEDGHSLFSTVSILPIISDPTKYDTDGDYFNDKQERDYGQNALAANAMVIDDNVLDDSNCLTEGAPNVNINSKSDGIKSLKAISSEDSSSKNKNVINFNRYTHIPRGHTNYENSYDLFEITPAESSDYIVTLSGNNFGDSVGINDAMVEVKYYNKKGKNGWKSVQVNALTYGPGSTNEKAFSFILEAGVTYEIKVYCKALNRTSYKVSIEQDNWVYAPNGAYANATHNNSNYYAIYMNSETVKTIIQNYYDNEYDDGYTVSDFAGKSEEQIKNACNKYAEILTNSMSKTDKNLYELIGNVSGYAGIIVDFADALQPIGFVFTTIDGLVLSHEVQAAIDKHSISKSLKNGNLNVVAIITEEKGKEYPSYRDKITHNLHWDAWEEAEYINKYASGKVSVPFVASNLRLNITSLNYYIPQQQPDGSWKVIPYEGFN